ncbi:MAG: FAD-dependent monooxygenase [Pseudomonadota bacterium]
MKYKILPVLIVGGGPVGLYAAARLGSLGIKATIIERLSEPSKRGSKALCVQSDVLDLLDNVGCRNAIIAKGCQWNVSRTYVGETEIRAAHFEASETGSPAFTNLPQWQVEAELRNKALASGNVDIIWDAQLTNIAEQQNSDSGSIVASYCVDGKEHQIEGSYLLGCDGVRSTVRKLANIAWLGKVHRDRFLIVDAKFTSDWPKERRFWFNAPSNAGRQIVIHPQPGDYWRIDWQLSPDCDPDAEITEDRIVPRIRQLAGEVPVEIEWASTYQFHQKYAQRMQNGRVFLLGDSAHALPPFGARGMNSGLQDAENMSWKLASVLSGKADEALLDTYQEERHHAAKENIGITGATIRFMVPPTKLHHLYRDSLLRFSSQYPQLNRWVNSGKMSKPASYRGLSAFGLKSSDAIQSGKLIPNFAIENSFSRTVTSRGFTIFVRAKKTTEMQHQRLTSLLKVVPLTDDFIAEHPALSNAMLENGVNGIVTRPDGYVADLIYNDIVTSTRMALKRCDIVIEDKTTLTAIATQAA